MLYGYPLESVAENWLHECIDAMLRKLHADVEQGNAPTAWPACIPEQYREKLSSRNGLRDRLRVYRRAFKGLSEPARERVRAALVQQNDVAGLLAGTADCETVDDLPKPIRAPIRELFEFCFGLLKELGIRDRHYQKIWEQRPQHYCPFCGLELFSAPGEPREDHDHFLLESVYPCAGINLRNLVPMGVRCNQRYKLGQNVLRRADGSRRRMFNPYAHTEVAITLFNSEPFAGQNGRNPRWVIDIVPSSPEAEGWDEVFSIRERYRNVLDPQFVEWLRPLKPWWQREMPQGPVNREIIVAGLARLLVQLREMCLEGREFLRVPMFEMLHKHCADGDERLAELIRVMVTN